MMTTDQALKMKFHEFCRAAAREFGVNQTDVSMCDNTTSEAELRANPSFTELPGELQRILVARRVLMSKPSTQFVPDFTEWDLRGSRTGE